MIKYVMAVQVCVVGEWVEEGGCLSYHSWSEANSRVTQFASTPTVTVPVFKKLLRTSLIWTSLPVATTALVS